MDTECDVIRLEDNQNYIILKEINYKNKMYFFLVNENDNKDFCIRRKEIKDGKEYLMGLDSEKEFDEVLREYEKYE